ncbi:hypothetical protein ANCDUO_23473 [Ancylostoma duodenale]|uniref:Uncharacterized protein n=1 Tax=Ancylostoma duodenale TaxID=51022 RepID=A0A0C2FID8_9BILA|nr:hypothetical protein ANCDUO_23473 [Ancylostoma duodenale]
MSGYHYIAFTCNDLRELPPATLLKAAFPDLQDCDWKCKTLNKLRELWRKVKTSFMSKMKEWGAEQTMNEISDWFSSTYHKIAATLGQ